MSPEVELSRTQETHRARRNPCVTSSVILMLVLAGTVAGCAQTMDSMRSLRQSVLGGSEAEEGSTASAPLVYYVGAESAPLYREPGKTVVARLPPYQKVYRSKLSRGYAFVRVAGSDQEGWLDNATLIWRLPRQGTASQPAAEPATEPDAASPAAAPPAEAATTDAASGDSGDGKSGGDTAAGGTSSAEVVPAAAKPASQGGTGSGTVSPSVFNPF